MAFDGRKGPVPVDASPSPALAAGGNAAAPVSANRRLALRLLAVVVAAFALGFAMAPLYDALCAVTGLNGRNGAWRTGRMPARPADPAQAATAGALTPVATPIDRTRTVTVEFTSTVMPGLPWEMRPLTARLDLHPGELQQIRYEVRNNSTQPVVGQAIPSISPGQAARHFQKLDCFCFRQQILAPGESRELPLTFILRPELDDDIRQITLSYAFFNVAEPARPAP